MSTSTSSSRGSPTSVVEATVIEYAAQIRSGGTASADTAQRRISSASEAFPATLNRIGNLFLLSGVAGTMMALFRFATEISSSASVGVSPKKYLLTTFSHAFSAFAVTIFGVALGAVALLSSHVVRSRLQRKVNELADAMHRLAGPAATATPPEQLLAQDLRAALASLTVTMAASTRETTAALAMLNVDLGSKLAPLSQFETLFGGLKSSVQQMTTFVKGQGDLIEMMRDLRLTADALRDTATSLPQAYRDHTTTAISELRDFGTESENSLSRINENIGQIASFVADVPDRVKRILDASLEKYDEATLGAFQSHLERLERIGATAKHQMPEVEAALKQIEARAVRTQTAIDELAVGLGRSLSRIETFAERLHNGSDRDDQANQPKSVLPRWMVPSLAILVVLAVFAAGPVDRFLQHAFAAPVPSSGDFALVHVVAGRVATLADPTGKQWTVVPGGSFGSDQAVVSRIGNDYAVIRDKTTKVLWTDPRAAMTDLPPDLLEQLADLDQGVLTRSARMTVTDKLVKKLGSCGASQDRLYGEVSALFLDADDVVASHAIAAVAREAPGCKVRQDAGERIAAVLSDGTASTRLAVLPWLAPPAVCATVPWARLDSAAVAGDAARQVDAMKAASECKTLHELPLTRANVCLGDNPSVEWCAGPPPSDAAKGDALSPPPPLPKGPDSGIAIPAMKPHVGPPAAATATHK